MVGKLEDGSQKLKDRRKKIQKPNKNGQSTKTKSHLKLKIQKFDHNKNTVSDEPLFDKTLIEYTTETGDYRLHPSASIFMQF